MRGIVLIAALAMGVTDVAYAASFRFGRPGTVSLGADIGSNVAIGDVDGNGRSDVMVTSSDPLNQHNLFIFLQRNDGALAAPIKLALPSAFDFLNPIKVADLDGDDVGEILVGTQYGVTVLRWNGQVFQSAHYAKMYGCEYMVSADVDGDGNADVFCHDWKANGGLLYGDGAGGLSAALNMTTSAGNFGTAFKGMRLKDVTGDGKPDLVITAANVNSFFVYVNNGLGAFFPGIAYPHPLGFQVWPAAVEVIDVDTDGIDEVVTVNPSNRPDAMMYVYRRNPLGYLTLSESIPTYDSTTALLAYDIDRDGAEDLLAGHYEFNAVGRYMAGIGALGSELLSDFPGFMGHSNGFALGDLNGDGYTDLAGATTSGLELLYGYRPKPGNDFNGDYVTDVLWRNPVTNQNVIWKSANNTTPQAMNSVGLAWTLQTTGDFNGDGKYDVFWRNTMTGQNVIWRSANAATGQAVTSITNLDWAVVGAGDFDGDGKSDLLWRNGTTGANAIWKSANYVTQQTVNTLSDLRWQVAGIGDFDGDGKSDILWRHSTYGNNAIWRSGKSASPQAVTTMAVSWTFTGVGDFDDDGRDDIVWRHAGTGANAIWRSANSATTQAVTGVTNLSWKIAAVGDYDGDGRSDLLWRNTTSGTNVIWRSAVSTTPKGVTGVTNLDWRIVR